MIRRLREYPTPEELRTMYSRTYNHKTWDDHKIRVEQTIRWLHSCVGSGLSSQEIFIAADLSCGDGTILDSLTPYVPTRIYGDFVAHPRNDVTGPIEETIDRIPPVDLFICTETIEHVQLPSVLLQAIRAKTRYLFLTTPNTENGGLANPEHIWEWDTDGMREMLNLAGFTGDVELIPTDYYTYQLWACK